MRCIIGRPMVFRRAVRCAANAMGFDIHRISKTEPPLLSSERMAIPPLCQEHVEGAVLYVDRASTLEALPRGGVVGEIGVAARAIHITTARPRA